MHHRHRTVALAVLVLLLPLATARAGEGPGATAGASSRAKPGSTGADARAAWRATRWGMTLAEVLAALPGEASALEKPVVLPDGNVVAAGIDGYALHAVKVQVRFVFDGGGKLALVSLRTPEKQYAGADVYAGLQAKLAAELGGKGEESRDDTLVDMRQTRWEAGASRVDLKYLPGTVVVLYSPR